MTDSQLSNLLHALSSTIREAESANARTFRTDFIGIMCQYVSRGKNRLTRQLIEEAKSLTIGEIIAKFENDKFRPRQ